MIKLTPDQENKLEAISWLTDPLGSRGQGRTTVLAVSYINHALKYRIEIPIFNHGNFNLQGQKELVDRISALCAELKNEKLVIKKSGNQYYIRIERIFNSEINYFEN
jgi:hypothetical protein